ncbi:uncharacterized protein LOC121835725 [Ixodes scapularis]|uniref:uncharacterized protein LOC121835725 n=1 Tax=Ixodes scapularis TaxID=6945 RepID=UPI001C38BF61|nr:uncharacterized protein LOC121835725 [Ixodes scapularis]
MATFVASRRGSPKLCFEGYMYTKHRTNDERTAWRCEKFQEGCRGRAITAGETTTVTQGHTCHLPSPENVAAARLQDEIKTAAKRSHDTPRNVVTACLQGARPATIAKLPKLSSLERKVNRVRREARGAAQVPHRIDDIIVPEHLRMTRTASPEVFLAGDTGCSDSERIMIFACNTDLCRLNTCETWLCDGTFKVAPEMFHQLCVVHGLYKGRVLPLVYCLLPNKREATYKRATRMLLEAIDDATSSTRQVHTIVIDFEKAEENAFRECIPDVDVHGCLFHFAQSIWRRIQELGMHTRFIDDSSYHLIVKKFIALCFCDVFDVCDRYRMLARQLLDLFGRTEQHQELLDYFENTWVGRPLKDPRFPISMWNCKRVTEVSLPRTNNSVEIWHRVFQNSIGAYHPTVFKLLDALLSEQVRVNAMAIQLDVGHEPPLYRKKEYEQSNKRLCQILDDYNNRDADSFLNACSCYVLSGS